ncbi:hypothetical protein [Nocardia ignorata]|uniref:hypothetical protein n=1 Tax=Nocardia ignorata TaxID=145285 RepID=UPI001FB84388|nr:hypothetical protein [Nocardia ignorata]
MDGIELGHRRPVGPENPEPEVDDARLSHGGLQVEGVPVLGDLQPAGESGSVRAVVTVTGMVSLRCCDCVAGATTTMAGMRTVRGVVPVRGLAVAAAVCCVVDVIRMGCPRRVCAVPVSCVRFLLRLSAVFGMAVGAVGGMFAVRTEV